MANEFKVKKGLIVTGSGSTIFDVQGSSGQLFSVTDSLTGVLFSVNDISGIPVLTVSSDDTINMGTYGAEGLKVSGSSIFLPYISADTTNSVTALVKNSSNKIVTRNLGTGAFSNSSPITVVNTNNLFSTGLAGTGVNAGGVTDSNFFGTSAGSNATNASNSNFIGSSAGSGATYANNSNFIGSSAGYAANNAFGSNFIGNTAGRGGYSAYYSNFIGQLAGDFATNANNSNFIGQSAGADATSASNSNFFGSSAGYGATYANNSNFIGVHAGYQATNATNANFFGNEAGYAATGATESNFLGSNAGYSATSASNSNFIGQNAGFGATVSPDSNFFGNSAGRFATAASFSNFFGVNAGYNAFNASNSNFMGKGAGSGATSAANSNFIGQTAGNQATDANNSNFFGNNSGFQATTASNSNFIGKESGYQAANANNCNFFGQFAGRNATSATSSNFIGNGAGSGATSAANSNFIGANAGNGATSASNSNLFGYKAGFTYVGNNIGSNNIIIGTNISLPSGTANRINIGGVLFGVGTYSNVEGNPSISAQTQGRIGVNIVNPSESLHVSGNTLVQGNLTATTVSATTYLNLPQASASVNGIITTGSQTIAGTKTFNNIISGSINGNSDTATNISNTGTVTLASATESNSITITQPSFTTNQPVKLLNFNWYSDTWSLSNIRSSSEPSNGLGVFFNSVEKFRFTTTEFLINNNTTLHSGNYISYLSSGSSPITVVNTSNLFSTAISGGLSASGVTNSNFFGSNAGTGATSANNSNFLGPQAGAGATSANNSNFLGPQAGRNASSANNSNFFGVSAGNGSNNALHSNFFGSGAGQSANNASNSNFMGQNAGNNASSANGSNFFGINAGQTATSASGSNFFGPYAGNGATNASNSNLFGNRAGFTYTSNNIGSNNIIIGTNISLPNASTNSINIGGVLFGVGTYSNVEGNPSITGQTNGRIGINCVVPTEALHVSGNTLVSGNVTALGFFNSSDGRLKDIISRDGDTVNFTWKDKRDEKEHIGYIAQEMQEKYPDQVSNNGDGYLTVNYIEILVAKIQELENRIKILEK